MKTIMTFAFFFCSFTTFGFLCPNCAEYMLDEDVFCPNCGWEKPKIPKVSPERMSPTSPQSNRQHLQSAYGNETVDRSESGDGLSMVGDRLAGTGRGLVTASLSPFNAVRGMSTGCHWLFSHDSSTSSSSKATAGSGFNAGELGPLGAFLAGGVISLYVAAGATCVAAGATLGTITTCADVTNGTLDMISAGYYGDWLYDSEASGKPSPWIWEREWYTGKMPWIDRK